MAIKTSRAISRILSQEYQQARKNPRDIFGFAHYGDDFPALNKITAGIHRNLLTVLAARPKVGKSMLVAGWVPAIAEQAAEANQVLRLITLETMMKSYQRRMAAILAQIPDPMNIRRGKLTPEQEDDYRRALIYLGELPIEYLSNEFDMDEKQGLTPGASDVTLRDIRGFLKPDTFWWVLDHIGLVGDLRGNDTTNKIFGLANGLATLAHQTSGGLAITHLTRASMGGGKPSIESLAGSDQVGRNADQILLLWRPYFESRNLTPEDLELVREHEPAMLEVFSRDEGGGIDYLSWSKALASFSELDVSNIVLPKK